MDWLFKRVHGTTYRFRFIKSGGLSAMRKKGRSQAIDLSDYFITIPAKIAASL
jgi:hypothetical protein